METRANHVWVGVVTLALLAIAAGFAVWLARLGKGDEQSYDIYFRQSVDGLATGSAVTYAGVPAGQVKTIELWKRDPSFVKVVIDVRDKIPVLMGTTAQIQNSFTGVSTIQLNGGRKGLPPITQPGPDGDPVIPTSRSGLGALLSSAPVLMEKISTVADRVAAMLDDHNQKQFAGILANTNRMTKSLADATPQLKQTLQSLQLTLADADTAVNEFQKVAANANRQMDPNGDSLVHDLRDTMKSAKAATKALQDELEDARPATQQLTQTTLPQAEASLRDLSAASRDLRALTQRIEDNGIGSVVGKPKLPEYKP